MLKLRFYLATCWFFQREICVYKRTSGKTNLCEQKNFVRSIEITNPRGIIYHHACCGESHKRWRNEKDRIFFVQ